MSRGRILIVEDESVVAWHVEHSLGGEFEVTGVAASAQEALASAAQTTPDLALMDIRIRGDLDGIQAAELLRQRHGVGVVYLTAHGDAETIERARHTEPYGYLLKPFHRDALLDTVRSALLRVARERVSR